MASHTDKIEESLEQITEKLTELITLFDHMLSEEYATLKQKVADLEQARVADEASKDAHSKFWRGVISFLRISPTAVSLVGVMILGVLEFKKLTGG